MITSSLLYVVVVVVVVRLFVKVTKAMCCVNVLVPVCMESTVQSECQVTYTRVLYLS